MRVAGLILAGVSATTPMLIPALYALPLFGIAITLLAVMRGYRFSGSEGIGSVFLEFMQRLLPRRGAASGT